MNNDDDDMVDRDNQDEGRGDTSKVERGKDEKDD
jgi:hypothetical protein